MSNTMQNLHSLGLNPFAVQLLAESMLKSAYVKHCGVKPLTFEFPVRRSDCEGWAGVRITIEAVQAAQQRQDNHCPDVGEMVQSEAVPKWLTYDAASDVLTIHGKRYAAGMFGEEGFLAPVGTLLRVEAGSPDVVTLTTVEQAEAVPSDDLHAFLDAAAGEGLILGGVDAADLYIKLFPERYAAAIVAQKASTP